MDRLIPSHIRDSEIIGRPLGYKWNDRAPRSVVQDEVPRLEKMIAEISTRGSIVLSGAFAQWIAFRLASHSEDSILFDYIDAVRACAIDIAYTDPKKRNPYRSLTWDESIGQVKGPTVAALKLLGKAVDQVSKDEPFGAETVGLASLAEFILPDKRPFRTWRNWAIARLVELEPSIDSAPDGNAVPIEALDPASNYDPRQRKKLLGDFLKGLDPKKNKYLRPAAEMKKAGFQGVPYEL
jgi:hypothetical protein